MFIFIVAASSTSRLRAQNIEYPAYSQLDQDFPIRVNGLAPCEEVVLRTSMTDAAGQAWEAHATYKADNTGSLDTHRDPSLGRELSRYGARRAF